ncbi:MAG TPA: hypothetical protein VE871_02655 [Longimicrobium sp.]|nr:hypothetical protein [Longimicrobium sp.]
MIVSFKDEGTRDVFEANDTRNARTTCPQHLWRVAARKLHHLDAAVTLLELTEPPGTGLKS